jgi:hypothetical protein
MGIERLSAPNLTSKDFKEFTVNDLINVLRLYDGNALVKVVYDSCCVERNMAVYEMKGEVIIHLYA